MPKDYSNYTDYESYAMLADRELEALRMKNSGMTNKEISENMGVKYNTVSIYLTRAIQKIDGTFDRKKEKAYRNSGAKRRRENPEYRESYNKYAREYYQKNSEKAKERIKKYRNENSEKYKNSQREYQREYQKKYRIKHPPRKWSELSEEERENRRKYQREYHKKYRIKSSDLSDLEREKRREYYRDYYRKKHPPKEKKMTIQKPKPELYLKSDQRAEKIIKAKADGKTVREIAKEQGCSTQNIYQILKSYRKRMESKNSSGE